MGRVWIHSVNCGPANTTDPVLARLDHEELRQWVELGLTGTEVCTITGWVSTITSTDCTKVRLFLKHLGLCGNGTISTSKLRDETYVQNEDRTIGYFYAAAEDIPPRDPSRAAGAIFSPPRNSKRDTELDNITSQYSRSNKRHSSGMISADRSLMFTSPITKRAKLGVSSFSHSPFTPLFNGCDGSMMEIFAEEKKGGLKEDNE